MSRVQSSQAQAGKPEPIAITAPTASGKTAAVVELCGAPSACPAATGKTATTVELCQCVPTCPHGRPVAKVVTWRDLEKLFKRIQCKRIQ